MKTIQLPGMDHLFDVPSIVRSNSLGRHICMNAADITGVWERETQSLCWQKSHKMGHLPTLAVVKQNLRAPHESWFIGTLLLAYRAHRNPQYNWDV